MSIELITLAAVIYASFSIFINRTLGNRKRLDQIREEINKYQKESNEAMKKKDEKKLKELENKQDELLKMTNEMLMLQFKPLLVILPVFFLASSFIRSTFPEFVITLPISLPTPVGFSIVWRNVFGPFGWFIICVLITSLLVEISTALLKKKVK